MKRFFSVSSIISLVESARASDRWLLRIALGLVLLATIWLVLSINSVVSVSDIRSGGTLQEGIVGTPRFVNPVLALTRADQDVTQLIYSGLLKIDQDGTLAPDLATGWTLSEDGTVYTIVLRQDASFHDSNTLMAEDVIYTIGLIQNNDLKSPLRSNWNGATAVAIDNYTIEITLDEPYAPFIENLTVGILPAHIWQDVPIEQVPFSSHNTTPIGSGPYTIVDTYFNNTGTVAKYELEAFAGHTPIALLQKLVLHFHGDETTLLDSWDQGDITSSAYLPAATVQQLDPEEHTVTEIPLTRTFGAFFNQNKSLVLRDAAVREALELALNRDTLVDQVLDGAGIPSQHAVQSDNDGLELNEFHAESGTSAAEDPLELATMVLEEAGWNQTDDGTWEKDIDGDLVPLAFTIKTVNTPVFEKTLAALNDAWGTLGVQITTEQFTQSDLVQSVIRERDFEMLLFGIDPGRAADVYAFWHSSQQDDPGLNIAQYTNVTVDDALETVRTATDQTELTNALNTINTIITEERPALFLFQPTVQYVTPADVQSVVPPQLSHPAERFTTISRWYTQKRMVWPFFTNNQTETISDTPSNQLTN